VDVLLAFLSMDPASKHRQANLNFIRKLGGIPPPTNVSYNSQYTGSYTSTSSNNSGGYVSNVFGTQMKPSGNVSQLY